MLNADAARYRTQDMVRTSEAHRAGRAIAKRRAERRNDRARRVISATAALVTFPIHR